MLDFDQRRRRTFIFLFIVASVVIFINISILSGIDLRSRIQSIQISIPSKSQGSSHHSNPDPNLPKLSSWHEDNGYFEDHARVHDNHPILDLMRDADIAWTIYEESKSRNFRETVARYRSDYGRNPPPRFDDWYKFARERRVHNLDDFGQIMDDLRPFWGVEPSTIRSLAAHLHENPENGISGLHIRDGRIWKLTNPNWRVETMAEMVKPFAKFLPDMDVAMNRLDQPRVIVPWENIQALLAKENATRQFDLNTALDWTLNMTGLLKDNDTSPVITDPLFFEASGKQYMLIAKEGCPPESHARNTSAFAQTSESMYKDGRGGFITNFNRSSDLCTIGPEVESKHGFLFAPSTIIATRQLVPIFGECKVNVNNDILFPANMYYKNDDRYAYDSTFDYEWDDKRDTMVWRGVTSGGTNTADNWQDMHRQRLVLSTNATVMASKGVRIMTQDVSNKDYYINFMNFNSSAFASEHTDVGFTGSFACVPDCHFYDSVWTYKNMTTLSEQFESKYVVDVDGHSFSGRWHAFLQSKSLGIKSTIFREWHDSRLFPWRHFVPLDNRYDELYSILTYFIGLGSPSEANSSLPYMPRHDFEARKLGLQGREWARKVLRREDIEIYTFRLLLEYARIIDDNRDMIGFSGDGSELDIFDAGNPAIP